MADDFRLDVTGRDLKVIAKGLRGVDNRELKKRFARELRSAAKPMVPAVRQSIRSIPTSGTQSTGLRKHMAKAVKLTVKTSGRNASVNIRVDGRKMPQGEKALPAYMEGTKPRWRHPVFGNQENWVQQPAKPYFYRALRPLKGTSRLAINRAIASITRDIT